jgi:UDP-GlcNAc:undecaprenyl-phosphate GlcNAc-1-phosphate transferase
MSVNGDRIHTMITFVFVFAISFLGNLLLTPCVRALAGRWGLVDRPDGRRKMHGRPTPVAGGLALLASTLLALPALLLAPESVRLMFMDQAEPLLGLLVAAVVICGVGVLDDYGLLRGRHKVLGQLVAIAIVIGSGVTVQRIQLFNWDLDLGLLAWPFTAFLLLGAMNSLNLLDGMDGMLSCVGLIVLSAFAAMAVQSGHLPSALIAVALVGSLAGFLRYNFPPASIFLGDCGSMLIGLVVGVLAIRCSLKGPATVALAAPLATLTIPILDTTAAIVRRKLTGRSLYTSDRGHLHHCLLDRGLSIPSVLFLVSFFCLFCVLGALGSVALRNELIAVVTAAAVVGILVGVRLFGYAEFLLARDRLLATASSFLQIRANGQTHATEVRLQGSVQWKEIWSRFTACAGEFNLQTIRLDLNAPFIHEGYHARWHRPDEESETPNVWFTEIPLMARGQVVGRLEVTGRRDDVPVWTKIAALTKLVESVEATIADRAEVVRERVRVHAAAGSNGVHKPAAHLDAAAAR